MYMYVSTVQFGLQKIIELSVPLIRPPHRATKVYYSRHLLLDSQFCMHIVVV